MNQRPWRKMTPDLARKILKEIGQPAEYDWVDGERHAAATYALECIEELRRFRERENLVDSLVVGVLGLPFEPEQHAQTAMKIREFKVSG